MAGVLAAHDAVATLTGDASLQRPPDGAGGGSRCAPWARRSPPTGVTRRCGCRGTRSAAGVEHHLAGRQRPGEVGDPPRRAQRRRGRPWCTSHCRRATTPSGCCAPAGPTSTPTAPRSRSVRPTWSPSGCASPGTSARRRSSWCSPRRASGGGCAALGVGLNPGRTGILEVLAAMGARVEVEEGAPAAGVEPQGDVMVTGAPLHGVTVEAAMVPRCIDELPDPRGGGDAGRGAHRVPRRGRAAPQGVRPHRRPRRPGCARSAPTPRRRPTAWSSTARARCARRGSIRPATIASRWPGRSPPRWSTPVRATASSPGPTPSRVSYPGFFDDLAALTSGSR